MDGVLVIDKPQGFTSHDVVAIARGCLRERRIGHTGTLDPLATGVLPLACGQATRLVRFLIASDKDYEATIRFGQTTDSYDITGTETSRTGHCPTPGEVEEALVPLRGEYLQVPPAFSAKKVAGERAYKMARRQQAVELAPVPVRVTRADVMTGTGTSVTIAITCSAGFYVRSFAHRLGEAVGSGACLESLRRTRSGEFDLTRTVSIEALREDPAGCITRLIPMEGLLTRLPSARLTDEGRECVAHGRLLDTRHLEAVTGCDPGGISGGGKAAGLSGPHIGSSVRLVDRDGRLVGIGAPGTSPGSLHPSIVLI